MKQTCRDLMTKEPFCCTASESVQRVAQLMQDQDVGSIPVCDGPDSKLLIGIVTDRDLVLKIVAQGRHPASIPVGDVMTRQIFSCHPDDDLEGVLESMERHQVRRIPVVDQQNRLVGIVAQADIATKLKNAQKTGEVVGEISRTSARSA